MLLMMAQDACRVPPSAWSPDGAPTNSYKLAESTATNWLLAATKRTGVQLTFQTSREEACTMGKPRWS